MNNDPELNEPSIDLSAEGSIEFAEFHEEDCKRLENIIYNIYIQERSIDSPIKILNSSSNSNKSMQDWKEEKKDFCIWDELRK